MIRNFNSKIFIAGFTLFRRDNNRRNFSADAAGYSIIEIVRLILDSQNTMPIVGNYKKCKEKFNP